MPKSIKKTKKIYLDYASGCLPNPSSIHSSGVKEKNKLEQARRTVMQILNAGKEEVIFTSGSTESNNLAILGLVQNFEQMHIVTTNIEHSSVLEVFKFLEKNNKIKVSYVSVGEDGLIDPREIKKVLTKDTVLVSVMYANNEIGTIQPIKEIAKEIRHFNKMNNAKVFFHTDATQATNYLPLSIPQLGVDLMSFNSAKICGPKGVGVLFVKKGTPISPINFGGNQEFGLRPGTENVAGIAAFAKVLESVEKNKEKENKRLKQIQNYFISKLQSMSFQKFGILINGDLENRLPNNINITIPNIPSDLLVIELSARGIEVSSKSACKSGDGKDSYVIAALRQEDGLSAKALASAGSVRFSMGRDTKKEDIVFILKTLLQVLNKLEKWYQK